MKLKHLKPNRSTYSTYSCLGEGKIPPTPYEIVTAKPLYYPHTGFAIKNPITEWYAKHQATGVGNVDWAGFQDPAGHIYTTYVQERRAQEAQLAACLDDLDKESSRSASNSEWLSFLEHQFAPLVFPLHAFQMIAAYIGMMAPDGRISVCAMFQSADEIKKVQWIACHTARIRQEYPAFAENRRQIWEEEEAWQPLRKAVENLLITYDWLEALIALNVCLKPLLEELMVGMIVERAPRNGSPLLALALQQIHGNERWHRAWSKRLIEYLLEQTENSRGPILSAQTKWKEIAAEITRPQAASGKEAA